MTSRRRVITHVYNYTLTEVVVVWDGFEVLHSSELAVRGRSILVLAAEFRQRPVKQDKMASERQQITMFAICGTQAFTALHVCCLPFYGFCTDMLVDGLSTSRNM